MADHFRQRTYTNSEGHIVSDRYTFYKPSSYKTITLEKDLTLDEISFIYYGTPLNYWAIGEVNNIKDPFVKIKKGTLIKIPAV